MQFWKFPQLFKFWTHCWTVWVCFGPFATLRTLRSSPPVLTVSLSSCVEVRSLVARSDRWPLPPTTRSGPSDGRPTSSEDSAALPTLPTEQWHLAQLQHVQHVVTSFNCFLMLSADCAGDAKTDDHATSLKMCCANPPAMSDWNRHLQFQTHL